MDLIINGIAAVRSSLGARRYYEGVMSALAWPGRVEVTRLPKWRTTERMVELLQAGRRDALFWSPAHRGPIAAHNHVMTVLDCINVEYVYRRDWRIAAYRRLLQSTLSRSLKVVTISEATRDAVLRNYDVEPGKVVAIPGPVRFTVPTRPKSADASRIPFVLMITNALPHKNTMLAGHALAASTAARLGIALRVVGAMDEGAIRACHASGIDVEVHHGISDDTLDQWIRDCLFLFSPSLAEGLNLPIAEALARGANVLCSDLPVHREFYDGEVLFCDPHSLDGMIAAIDHAINLGPLWPLGGPQRVKPSFADVASEYRALFLRLGSRIVPSDS